MTTPETTSRRGLYLGLALGVPVLAYGVRGVFVDANFTHPADFARWFVAVNVAHDFVLVPLVLGASTLMRRAVPRRAWPAVRTALLITGVLVLAGWPFVRGYGRDPDVPSALARDYGAGLAVAVAAVWTAVAVWLLVTRLWAARTGET